MKKITIPFKQEPTIVPIVPPSEVKLDIEQDELVIRGDTLHGYELLFLAKTPGLLDQETVYFALFKKEDSKKVNERTLRLFIGKAGQLSEVKVKSTCKQKHEEGTIYEGGVIYIWYDFWDHKGLLFLPPGDSRKREGSAMNSHATLPGTVEVIDIREAKTSFYYP
jgi:hypothetical protein